MNRPESVHILLRSQFFPMSPEKLPVRSAHVCQNCVYGRKRTTTCKQPPHQFVSIHRSVRSSVAQGHRSRNAGRSHQTPSRDAEAARFNVTLSTPAKMPYGAQASISTGCLQRLSNAREGTQKSTFPRLVFRRRPLIGWEGNVLEAQGAAR
jgi:hypothetical protein